MNGTAVWTKALPTTLATTYNLNYGGAWERPANAGYWLFLLRNDGTASDLLTTDLNFNVQATLAVPTATNQTPKLIWRLSDGSLLLTAVGNTPFGDTKYFKTNAAATALTYNFILTARVLNIEPSICGTADRLFISAYMGTSGGSGGSSNQEFYHEITVGAAAMTRHSVVNAQDFFTQPNVYHKGFFNTAFLANGDKLTTSWASDATAPGPVTITASVERQTANDVVIWSKTLPSTAPLNTYFSVFEDGATVQSATVFGITPGGTQLFSTQVPCSGVGCSLSVTLGGTVCNNNGTPSNPADDTFYQTLSVAATGQACGTTYTTSLPQFGTFNFGSSYDLGPFQISGGNKAVTFTATANPASTQTATFIAPPTCSNTPTGCSYETASVNFGAGYAILENMANGAIRASIQETTPGFPNSTYTYRETNLDAIGTIGTAVNQSVVLPSLTTTAHTPDGNFVSSDGFSGNNVVIKKSAPGGAVLWTKNVPFTVPATAVAGSAGADVVAATATAIYFQVKYSIQPVATNPPTNYVFFVKTDQNGVKISETPLPTFTSANYLTYSFQAANSDGSYLYRTYTGYSIKLGRIAANGTQSWDNTILSDLPSSTLHRIETTPDGSAVYVTTYSNSQSYVTKFNFADGKLLWTEQLGTAFVSLSQDGFVENTNVRDGAVTADGGIVVAFNFTDYFSGGSAMGYAYGKLSPNGSVIYVKKDINIGDLAPALGTPDGGMVFAGVKATGGNYEFLKLNSLGDPTPACGNTTALPDLTLSTLNVTGTSVAVGGVLNFKFDLKNIGTAAASGNFTVKSYLSTDNILSANDIQNGSVPTGNLAAGQTVAQVAGALTVPAGTAAGNYFVILKVDADGQIAESNENNNTLASTATISVTTSGGTTGADLKITITADKTTVPQWGNVNYTVTAKNEGTAPISSASIRVEVCSSSFPTSQFYNSTGLVYASTPGAPTVGSYNFVEQIWTISNLAAGASGTLTIPIFTLTTGERKVVAFAKTQSPADPDSQPSASFPANCTPVQDDEAVAVINLGQSGQSVSPLANGSADAEIADFSLFPNPTDGFASIELSNFLGKKITISATDIFGKNVFYAKLEELKDSAFDLDLSGEMAGVYFIKIEAEGLRPVVKRLIINKL